MKKIISLALTLILALSCTVMLFGCNGPQSEEMPVEEGAEVITVYLRDFEEWSNQYSISAIRRFNSILDDGIQVEYLLLDESVYENKVTSERENGKAPDLYLISYSNLWASIKPQTAYLLPLDDILSEKMIADMTDSAKSYVTFNGQIYAAPACFEPSIMLFYSKSMFEQAGITKVPTTFDEMLDACNKLSKVIDKRKGQTVVGTPIGLPRGWANIGQFWNVSGGEMPISQDWSTCLVNNHKDGYKAFLEYWSKLYTEGYAKMSDTAGGYNEIIRELCEGRVAMTFGGSYEVSTIMAEYPETADDIGLALIPTLTGDQTLGATTSGGWSYVIDKAAASRRGADGRTHAELAAIFLEFLLTDPVVAPEYFEKSSYSKFAGYTSVIAANDAKVDPNDPFYSVIKLAHETAMTDHNNYPWEITSAHITMIEQVVLGKKTVDQAIKECHNTIAGIISSQHLAGQNPQYVPPVG